MGIEINTNTTSMMVQNSLSIANSEVAKSIAKISIGKKIGAMEDAANMVLAETLEAQARGSNEAIYNTQTGINMLQTAESGMGSINDNLQRMRELSVQAANGTYGEQERQAIKDEMAQLSSEINRTAKSTSFNKTNLLDGSTSELRLQIGANSEEDTNSIDVGKSLGDMTTDGLGLPTPDDMQTQLNTPDDFAKFIDTVDGAMKNVTKQRSSIGAVQNTLEDTVNRLDVTRQNMLASQSRIRDVDIASEASKLTQNQILQHASTSLLAQANQSPGMALVLV